ncbi:MAG: cohesin domain-containing protein, partial [Acutalibacteraceae bacterium]
MKKLIALCLAIMLVFTAMPVIGVAAANTGKFVVSAPETATLGETFDVAINIAYNPGIVSAKVKVAYDSNVLELVSKEDGEFSGVAYGPTSNNPFVINWVDTIHPNNTTNGPLVTLTFKVKDGAQLGQTPITLSFNPDDVYDLNFDNVDFTTVDGCVDIISCRHTNTETTPAVDSTCIAHGHGEYVTCLDCGEIIEGSDEPLPLSDHNYVEVADSTYLKSAATFTKKAVYYKSCSVCGLKGTETFEYGELLFYESAPQFVVSTQDALRGETVDVTVSLKNNPGIVSAKVNVFYDSNVLELVSKEDGEFSGV